MPAEPSGIAVKTNRQILLMLAMLAVAGGALARGLVPLAEKPPAPSLNLPDMHGQLHRLADYRGRTVMVHFWASWCHARLEEFPALEQAWAQLRSRQVMVLAVNVGEPRDQVSAFVAQQGVSFPVLLDLESKLADGWKLSGLPTTFLVDPWGRVVYRARGKRDWQDPRLLNTIQRIAP